MVMGVMNEGSVLRGERRGRVVHRRRRIQLFWTCTLSALAWTLLPRLALAQSAGCDTTDPNDCDADGTPNLQDACPAPQATNLDASIRHGFRDVACYARVVNSLAATSRCIPVAVRPFDPTDGPTHIHCPLAAALPNARGDCTDNPRMRFDCASDIVGCTLLVSCSGVQGLSQDDNSRRGAEYLRRWKVTDASGNVLSQGCAKQPSLGGPAYAMNVIDVKAGAGTVITYEDNLGGEYVEKERVTSQQLPTSDAYRCSNQDTYQDSRPWFDMLDTVQVADADPPATIQDVQLVNPGNDPKYGTVEEGFRLQLAIRHAGVLHLNFPDLAALDAGADGGTQAGADSGTKLDNTYPAMTIQ